MSLKEVIALRIQFNGYLIDIDLTSKTPIEEWENSELEIVVLSSSLGKASMTLWMDSNWQLLLPQLS